MFDLAFPVFFCLRHCAAPEAAKAQLRCQQSRMVALLEAARQGQVLEVTQLLERGCPPDAADAEGRTALTVAATHGQQVGGGIAGFGVVVCCLWSVAVREGFRA